MPENLSEGIRNLSEGIKESIRSYQGIYPEGATRPWTDWTCRFVSTDLRELKGSGEQTGVDDYETARSQRIHWLNDF